MKPSHVSHLQRRAMQAMRDKPWICGQELTAALGVTRSNGLPMSTQGAGGWGVRYARKLEKLGYVESRLIDDGYRTGFRLTVAGAAALDR